ncbi:hypothetical protein [Alkalihalophilus marmarensis]|uniref:Helix-turn-helix n=1 Tax=Alkalihalophilus marmarensis DSM 21297 TaxID=1188261 RepID=U6SRP9_9BACI|nr:hypothetical protein [Alkalihalophilus marmarensis]ERN54308.1 hypothetical protein A33I_07730 [Alkalihalophilus marmarensis DSM 21297]
MKMSNDEIDQLRFKAMKKAITATSIANELGVSPAAVSQFLRLKSGLSYENEQKLKKIIEDK